MRAFPETVLTENTMMELSEAAAAANQFPVKVKPGEPGVFETSTARSAGGGAVVPATEP
jgi:hypothetical protein